MIWQKMNDIHDTKRIAQQAGGGNKYGDEHAQMVNQLITASQL